MKNRIFTGSATAIVTPMNQDFSINYPKLGELIDWQLQNGTDALVICGTTGESSTMTDEEHVECIRYAVEKTAGRVPVIAGAGSNDTAYAVWLSEKSKEAGADALLHVTPYYNKTSQRGLIRHFTTVADATDLPVILYNVPSRTGVDIKPETYLELSKHPHIAAIKEANGDIAAAAKTMHLCGDALDLYSGNDDQIVPMLSLGGVGVISVLSNVMPAQVHHMCRLFMDGDAPGAGKMQVDLIALVGALFSDVNPIPVKEALNLMGMNAGPCRLPLIEMTDPARNALKDQLMEHGLI